MEIKFLLNFYFFDMFIQASHLYICSFSCQLVENTSKQSLDVTQHGSWYPSGESANSSKPIIKGYEKNIHVNHLYVPYTHQLYFYNNTLTHDSAKFVNQINPVII